MCGPCGESCGGALRDTMLVKGDTGHAASRAPHISRARHVRHARPQPGVGRSGSGTPRSRPRACPAAPTRTRWPGIIRWPETQVQVNRVAAAWRPSPGSVRDAGRQRSLLEERTRPGTPRPGARPGASPPLERGVGWLTAGLRRSCPCGMPWAATAFFFELHLGCSWSRSQATFPGPGPDRRGSRSLLQSKSAIIMGWPPPAAREGRSAVRGNGLPVPEQTEIRDSLGRRPSIYTGSHEFGAAGLV